MIHFIWSMLLLVSIGFSLFTGNLGAMTEAVMDGAKEAVNLCIVMAAVVGLWSGIMEIGVQSGIIDHLSKAMQPFLKWIFPKLSANSKAVKYMASNFAANLLGLGWAATPAGLSAMEELKKEGEKKNGQKKIETATNEMCTFILLNVSSLQLIPLTIIVYRGQYGSAAPAAILLPGLIATMTSSIAAVLFAKIMCKRSGKE